MHKITFFPIGNADCCMVDLENGKKLLFDFANYEVAENNNDPRINLGEVLHGKLKEDNRIEFDVVAFTHADDDHVHGASEFFHLEHADKYQGEGRIKIKELWVPAAMILEENLRNDSRVLRAEARYRLKNGKGIRVFSRPEKLKNWLEKEGVDFESRRHLITGAGKFVPGFSEISDGIEFFVHSPFSVVSGGKKEDRNEASLILHITFYSGNRKTKFFLIGDTIAEVLEKIVVISHSKGNDEYLEWDIYDVPHHCSYKALSSEKGAEITKPIEGVKTLLSNGGKHGKIISSSNIIPKNTIAISPLTVKRQTVTKKLQIILGVNLK